MENQKTPAERLKFFIQNELKMSRNAFGQLVGLSKKWVSQTVTPKQSRKQTLNEKLRGVAQLVQSACMGWGYARQSIEQSSNTLQLHQTALSKLLVNSTGKKRILHYCKFFSCQSKKEVLKLMNVFKLNIKCVYIEKPISLEH